MGAAELAQLGRPVVTIGCQVDGLPSIRIDNRTGILEAMQNLFELGRTRIAFVGWMTNGDFQERQAAYCEALAAKGIALDPNLLIDPGAYEIVQCHHAFARFLARGGIVDGIIAGNDKAAIGAIEAVRATGKRIPADVAVIGFDDTDLGRFYDIPLSSVRDRPDEIARVALRVLLARIDGQSVPLDSRVPTRVVVRDSSRMYMPTQYAPFEPSRYCGPKWRLLLMRDLVQIAQAPLPVDPQLPPEHYWPLVGLLADAIDSIGQGHTPSALSADLWRQGAEIGGGVTALQLVVERLREAGFQLLQRADRATFGVFMRWLLETQEQIAGTSLGHLSYQLERQRESTVSQTLLLTKLTESGVDPMLIDWMEASWADWAALALWSHMDGQASMLKVASIFQRGIGAHTSGVDCPAKQFPGTSLAPVRFSRSSDYILKLCPLRIPAREWGYIATYERYHPTGYDTLTGRNKLVSTMLERNELLESLTDRQNVLQMAYERERKLTEELSNAISSLRTTQSQLLHSEKMAALGNLVAGVSHELRNPLNFVNNLSQLSNGLLSELEELIAQCTPVLDEPLRESFAELITLLTRNGQEITRSGQRADAIISMMLLHARSDNNMQRSIEFNGLVEQALALAYHSIVARQPNMRSISIVPHFANNMAQVTVIPQRLSQALINIIDNACYALWERSQHDVHFEPVLTLTTRRLSNQIQICIHDNGIGIPPELRNTLFEPFVTSKPPGEGTGLGLSLAYDIVVLGHGGSIQVESEINQYTEIIITLPTMAS